MHKALPLLLLLASCATKPVDKPTPFVVGDKKVVVIGCEKLKEELKEKADC
jgi:hypothetical protein